MTTAVRRITFNAGHRLWKHEGRCEHIHGHNYVAYFHATARELDEIGRVIDFNVLKTRLGDWIEENWDLDYNPHTVAAFTAEHGFDPREVDVDSDEFMVWLDWQRDRIGALVGRIRDEAHAVRPGIRVSAAVLSRYHLGRHQAMQDWIAWLRRGQLDTACIMAYDADNDLVVQKSILAMEGRGAGTIWTGMSAGDEIGLTIDRIDRVRREARPEGLIFFPWGGFDAAERQRLREGPFVDPAQVQSVAGAEG